MSAASSGVFISTHLDALGAGRVRLRLVMVHGQATLTAREADLEGALLDAAGFRRQLRE